MRTNKEFSIDVLIKEAKKREVNQKLWEKKHKREDSVTSMRYSEYNIDLNRDPSHKSEVTSHISTKEETKNRPVSFGGEGFVDELPS